MKKILTGVFIFSILFFGCVYIFIPSKITVSSITVVNSSIPGTQRYLSEKSNRIKWWPFKDSSNEVGLANNISFYMGYNFNISPDLSTSSAILITSNNEITNNEDINSNIIFLERKLDTTLIQWQYVLETSVNPIQRIKQYRKAQGLKNITNDILKNFKRFVDKAENIYNLKIEKTTVKDTLLLATRKVFFSRPGVTEIYNMITNLKNYIESKGAEETNFPMLNVHETERGFEAMVAFPINKEIKETDNYLIKKMFPGKILVAEIRGGLKTIEKAFNSFDYYISDYEFSMPAIPFELLMTDRTKETDSTKWITRIYYPVR